jgi:hypothetical protein
MMKKKLHLISIVLTSVLSISACSNQSADTLSTTSSPLSSTLALGSDVPSSPTTQPTSPVAATNGQSYREPTGLFEISFPKGYTYQATNTGVVFLSSDGGFGGSVDFGSAQGGQLTPQQLEAGLRTEYEQRLQTVTWQGTKPQPDGSIRVDWVGTAPDGNKLDANSFIEQRGDTILILSLFGINKSYQEYTKDSEAILGTYRVRH